jgi:hypothetical protein
LKEVEDEEQAFQRKTMTLAMEMVTHRQTDRQTERERESQSEGGLAGR